MKIQYHSAVVFVSDIAVSRHFYASVLGMKIDMDMGSNVIFKNGISLWEISEKHIIPTTVGIEKLTEKGHGFELYFETTDLKSVYDALKKKKVVFLHEMLQEPWGQNTVRIKDPDDNIIEIGETLETFLNRMKSDGMSAEEMASKTGMDIKDIARVLGE